MATSGTSSFSQNRDQLCRLALSKIERYGVGLEVSPEDMTLVANTLNMMIKSWGTQGLHLWAKGEATLHLSQYTAKYSLGSATNDAYVCSSSDQVTTILSGDLATLATNATVESTVGMTIGDHIGIVLTDKSLYWTTIASIPSTTTLTISSGITGPTTATSLVFTFTNRVYKPLRILDARLIEGYDAGSTSTQTERYLDIVSHEEYFQLPNKTTNGASNQVSYLPNRIQGDFYIYPRPSDCSARIQFTYERVIEDLNTLTDDFDLPVEWEEPIVWQLALRIAPDFQMDSKIPTIGPIASAMLDNLKDWDTEINSININPSRRYY